MPRRSLLFLILLALMVLVPSLPQSVFGTGASGVAWADDDDDDDDDGGGSDDDDDDGGRRPQSTPAAPTPIPPPPAFAAREIIASGLSEDDFSDLVARGFSLLSEGGTWRRFLVPQGMDMETARSMVRGLPSAPTADFNHFYRTDMGFSQDCQGIECPAREIVDWPDMAAGSESCGAGIRLGMIDTGINVDHANVAGASLSVRRLALDQVEPSEAVHGTAVAALFVGDPGSRSPGLIPNAHLVAVDVFYRAGSDERTDAATLVEALAQLAEEDVSVINLSLSGPENAVLSEVIDEVVGEHDIVVVSAVGNSGPSAEVAFPAGFEPVIGVTAVDRDMNIYRRAVRGAHVDLAAPGVAVWSAASISGARTHTGTSFATPFVSAAAAILRQQRPDLSAPDIAAVLQDGARDLGEPGRDEIFGAGLIDGELLCADPN